MIIKDYFLLAYKNVRQRGLRSWLTMIGIFIGIAAVVALISLSQGLQSAIGEQFIRLGSDKLIVQAEGSGFGPPGTDVVKPLTIEDKKMMQKIKGVDVVVGRLLRSLKIEFNDELHFEFAASFPEADNEIDLVIEANNYQISQGRLLRGEDKFEVMVGKDFAVDHFDKSLELRDKIFVEGHEFSVVGILKKSGNPQQDSTLVIPEEALREVIGAEGEYDVIPVKIESGENIAQVSERIEKALRKQRNVEEGKEDFSIQTPENILSILNNVLLVVQGVLVGIAGIALIVGGIGIMNTMYTAVIERTKEVGIMKATGARNSQILSLFMVESGMLGLFGGLIGVSLGFTISKTVEIIAFNVFESYLIRASFPPLLLIGALLFAFLVGMFSGIFPARQASKLSPVEAFRE
jgi:putative ABC transport system permease protein